MVFKPFTHLARQNFAKAFTYGYHSVVAASQSSYTSSTPSLTQLANHSSKYTRTAQLQNAFHNPSSSSNTGTKAGQHSSNSADGGLAAYYAAWQHAQQTGDDSDWRQFQIKKRSTTRSTDTTAKPNSNAGLGESLALDGPHDIKKVAVNVDVSAKVEEAVAREIQIQEEDAQVEEAVAQEASATQEASSRAEPSTTEPSSIADNVAANLSQSACEQIVQLASAEQYAEIPSAFESLLRDGLTPSVEAYNGLLIAAVKLHPDPSQAITRALDVYSDMLRRRIIPNADTYKTLVTILVTHSLEMQRAKASLERQRIRFGGLDEPGKFLFQSSELESELLAEDHSLTIAIKLFDAAVSRHEDITFSLEVYHSLIVASAESGKVEDMIRVYAHMEAQKVIPHAAIFPAMINAFGTMGDLKSAIECYNEYRALAISDDNGTFCIVERRDGEVYAAVISAYLSSDHPDVGMRFLDRIRDSFDEVKEDREARLNAIESIIVRDAFIRNSLGSGDFVEAINQATTLQDKAFRQVMSRVCMSAADAGDVAVASDAYQRLTHDAADALNPAISMLAMHIREGDVSGARSFWSVVTAASQITPDMIQPTTMYAVGLMKSGHIEEGVMEARKMFNRVRSAATSQQLIQAPVRDEIDEALELLGRLLMHEAVSLSAPAAMTYIRSMLENGGLLSPVAEYAIACLGPMGISQLSVDDLTLALHVQAGMIVHNSGVFEAPHLIRFAHILDLVLSTGIPLDAPTTQLIDQAIARLVPLQPELVQKWQGVPTPSRPASVTSSQYAPATDSSLPTSISSEDSFDPYAHSTDYRGSSAIADLLETTKGRAETHLDDALIRFKNMRRIGRHPRYITYAKLITAATKSGRADLIHDIFAMAKHDVPLLPQYQIVKHGWVSIFDAMIAACLTFGERALAGKYHQELLDIGAAPSANTYGLYITTLKESTKTFDEATEAVKIFHRAVAEGVEPTSFLYNALIGKLGKARRIDDCLQYFAEMRTNGVRPTSVTYGTVVNALCRVSDERFAEEMFDEMESMSNYKPRPAPYNSIIQYFLNTKRDRSKVLTYYERMKSKNIEPTMHTYKLLIDSYASLEPIDMPAAERVLNEMKASGHRPQAVHYASLIHAKGCVSHDMAGARRVFDSAVSNPQVRTEACLYQALFESMVANHEVRNTVDVVRDMEKRGIAITPYIANTLIHGWATEGNIEKSCTVYDSVGIDKREPSTYEAMTRAFLAAGDRESATSVVQEMLSRGYPSAVAGKILELVAGGAIPTTD